MRRPASGQDDAGETGPPDEGRAAGQLGPGREHPVAAHSQLDLGPERVVHPDHRGGPAAHPRPGRGAVDHEHVAGPEPAEVEGGGSAGHAGPDHDHVGAHDPARSGSAGRRPWPVTRPASVRACGPAAGPPGPGARRCSPAHP